MPNPTEQTTPSPLNLDNCTTTSVAPASVALPGPVEAIRQGHIISAQATAVVAALFAGIQAQLLSGIPDDEHNALIKALTLFSYAGLVLNIGASLSAMGLLDYLGEVPEKFWRKSLKNSIPPVTTAPETDFQLLKSHGGNPKMYTSYIHCHISLIFGAYCLVLQMALLVWLKSESTVVFAVFIVICSLSIVTTYPGQMVLAFFSGIVGGVLGKEAEE